VIEKIRSTKVDAGNLKHELLNQLRSTTAVNLLIITKQLIRIIRHHTLLSSSS